jgi:hypothetical protein
MRTHPKVKRRFLQIEQSRFDWGSFLTADWYFGFRGLS